jgi:hypothetical protein
MCVIFNETDSDIVMTGPKGYKTHVLKLWLLKSMWFQFIIKTWQSKLCMVRLCKNWFVAYEAIFVF